MLLDKKNPIAQAKSLKKLIGESGLTVKEVAKRIGKSPSYVSNTIRLLSLPEALQDALVSGLITPGHGRALAAIPDKREMISAYKQILKTNGSVRMAEALARKIKKKGLRPKKYEILKRKISRSLGGAEVELFRSRIQTRVVITFKGGYAQTEPLLQRLQRRLTKPHLSKGQ